METSHTLASLRVRAGMTIEEAAPALGVSRWTLAKYEADSSTMPSRLLDVAASLYLCPRADIYVGAASDMALHIREAAHAEPPC